MTEIVEMARRLQEASLGEQYRTGFVHGIEECLDQLENSSSRAPAGGYRGPVPEELKGWISSARKAVEREKRRL